MTGEVGNQFYYNFYCLHEPNEDPEDLCDGLLLDNVKEDIWLFRDPEDTFRGPITSQLTIIDTLWKGEDEDAKLFWRIKQPLRSVYGPLGKPKQTT